MKLTTRESTDLFAKLQTMDAASLALRNQIANENAFIIDFTPLNITGNHFYGNNGSETGLLILDVGSPLNASVVDFSGEDFTFLVGVSDTPTRAQIITKLVALGEGKIVNLGNNIIQVIPTNSALMPLDFFGGEGLPGSGMTPKMIPLVNVATQIAALVAAMSAVTNALPTTDVTGGSGSAGATVSGSAAFRAKVEAGYDEV